MISYKRSVAPENVRQLFDSIDVQHEDFCRADDQEKKADALRLLKGYATQYLNQVVHVHKFKTAQVERVLSQSVNLEFDPREASGAFEHLAKYAQNLLGQPWREEFKTLNLTSGYYIHNVQSYLVNPHEILIAMGYTNIDDDTLQMAMLPNPIFLKEISRDCFLASQECLILSHIWDFVQTQLRNCGVTPVQVYHYRKAHVGDVPTIGRKICFDIRQQQHQEERVQYNKSILQQSQNVPHRTRTCPVGTLVDVEDAMNGITVGDLPEKELVQKVHRYTQREHDHIYDPVSTEDSSNKLPNHKSKMQLLSPTSPSINSSSSNFVYPQVNESSSHTDSRVYNQQHMDTIGLPMPSPSLTNQQIIERYNRSSSNSPFIPTTVSAFRSIHTDDEISRKPSNSSSSSSSPRGPLASTHTHNFSAFQKDKISLEELQRLSHHDSKGSESSGLNEQQWLDIELCQPAKSASKSCGSRSRQPIIPPLSSRSRKSENAGAKYYQSSEEADETLAKAYKYKTDVKSLVENNKSRSSVDPFPGSDGYLQRDSGSRVSSDRESENKSSGSSEASSWGYGKSTLPTNPSVSSQPATYSTTDGKKSCSGSLKSSKSNYRPEFESQYQRNYNTNPSPRKSPPTETNLDSLETVYFNQLVTKRSESPDQTFATSRQYDSKNDPNFVGKTSDKYNNVSLSKEMADVTNYPDLHRIRVQLPDSNLSPPTRSSHGQDEAGERRKEVVNKSGRDDKTVKGDRDSRSSSVAKKSSNIHSQQKGQGRVEPDGKIVPWQCPHCTYINFIDGNVCEMCAKSRDFVDEGIEDKLPKLYLASSSIDRGVREKSVETPSYSSAVKNGSYGDVSGSGSNIPAKEKKPKEIVSAAAVPDDKIECPHCTLLNPKHRVVCDCCQNRLKPVQE